MQEERMIQQGDMYGEMESLKKSLMINRVISIVSSVVALVLIVVLVIGINSLNAFVEEIQVVADQVAKIDTDQVNDAIEKFNATVEQIDFAYIDESFKEVDMKKIGEIVETIDAAELEETLENINNVSEKLKKLSETISNFFSFGR